MSLNTGQNGVGGTNPPALTIQDGFEDFGKQSRAPSGSSILDEGAIEEHGRTYHSYKQGTYLLPNDGAEQDRLDLQHAAVSLLLDGKLAWAPVVEPKNVLDVGTGTGIWAIEYAKRHPDCAVIGSDLSMIQPTDAAANCSFVKEDAENDEWAYQCDFFDYVHLRLLFTCFGDIRPVLRNVYKHLKPGGWVEFQDHTPEVFSSDGSSSGTAMERFGETLAKGLAAYGRDATRMKHLKDVLAAEGYIDIVEKVLPYPVGDWPKHPKYRDVGKWMAENVVRGLEGSVKMLLAGGLSTADVHDLVAQVKLEIQSGHVHAYMPFYVVYARKGD
ncbi:hypothetical protein JDV02_000311 [Purpureocillium takamizusanense]|uniref:S-adenosyl-L-methionine-dependent methyltransferase n=1 Tax=Purpureocillium takamizusanense TaxID=2060973 RepID=A0A9Q8Q6Y7_9HYPO|nr:uncharacterized protein JDV02_000311 [Purpureocillium takamizusanense]UNI13582.1 hypothetical protein JDV02_000311 [Purpureocillium takamizusanense]